MKRWEITFSVLIFFLAGCNSRPTPSPSPIPAPTFTPTAPAPTLLPTAVYTSTDLPPTPEYPLTTDGPYLLYRRIVSNQVQLVLMDANGQERKILSLPPEITNPDSENAVTSNALSPDGKWLAFYTGSAGQCFTPDMADVGDKNLALNLMDLTTGQTQPLTTLLPVNYPENFIANAEAAIQTGLGYDSSAEKARPHAQERLLMRDSHSSLVAQWTLPGFCGGYGRAILGFIFV